ncbi:MAG: radical SAM protein [Promethearchaeota archaeon]
MRSLNDVERVYARSNYRVVGKFKHSAIKPCHYLIAKLFTGRMSRNCYKGYFGIKSEKCIQCTPALPFCNHNCVFCWRDIEKGSLGPKFNTTPDDPEFLVNEFIKNQKNLLDYHYPLENFIINYEVMMDILEAIRNNDGVLNTNVYRKKSGVSANKIETAIVLLKILNVVKTSNNQDYFLNEDINDVDDPEQILKENVTTIEEIKKAHESAHKPSHAAISLAGEPTLYPYISELIRVFKKRNFTTFIVSNGTTPEILRNMDCLPTQLYVTLPPPDERLYKKIHRPLTKGTFEKIKKTLSLMQSLSCRTCLRITLVKGLNGLTNPSLAQEYVSIIKRSKPNFLDVKGFSVEARAMLLKKRLGLGGSGTTIGESQPFAPTFEDVYKFAKMISDLGNFPIVRQSRTGRDVLLTVNWPKNKPLEIEKN